MIARLIVIGLLLVTASAQAAIKYIAPAGSNSNNGTSTSLPYKTWAFAFSNTACGDTLLAMDGEYTIAVNGAFQLTKVCTAASPFTVRSMNERQAFINGDATAASLYILNSAYIVIQGMRVRSTDRAGSEIGVINAYSSNNITFQRNICSNTNRYFNAGHCFQNYQSSFILLEENECYWFHRHCIYLGGGTNNSVARRNYCSARGYADIPGGNQSATPDTGEDCILVYPGSNNVIENNICEGYTSKCFAVEALGTAVGNKYLGNISIGANIGYSPDIRINNPPSITYMPRDTDFIDNIAINSRNAGFRFRGVKNTQCLRCTALTTGFSVYNPNFGFVMDSLSGQGDGDPTPKFYSSLALNGQSFGYSVSTSLVTNWLVDYPNSTGNGTNYSPSSSAKLTHINTDSAGLGTCLAWIPDSSPLKNAGRDGLGNVSDIGASVLFRYVNGALTTTPLWDPTTGEFPHGVIVPGVNDIDGSSPYNVHQRLNINTNGCGFPAVYPVGTPPQNPSSYQSTTGTSSTSHAHTLAGTVKGLLVFSHIRDGGANVGSITSVTSCAGEALDLAGVATTSPAYHKTYIFKKLNPTTGTCTINVSTSGTVGTTTTTSIAIEDISGFGLFSGAAAFTSTPSVTVATNPGETVYVGTSAGSAVTITAGSGQTIQTDTLNGPSRLTTSTKPGSAGGSNTFTLGATNYAATAGISVIPATPLPPSSAVLTVTKMRFECGLGLESTNCFVASPDPAKALNASVSIGTNALVRVRAEVSGSVAEHAPWSSDWYCNTNGGAFFRVMDNFAGHEIKWVGPSYEPLIPSSLTPLTQRFGSGNYVTGYIQKDEASVVTIGAITSSDKTELVGVFEFASSVGNVHQCRPHLSDGAPLDAYAVAPTMTVVGPQGSFGK